MKPFSNLHKRLGDFWWYSLLIFLAARSGDAIQAFIGLWLVPRYVPQSELGAVLPLLQVAGAWGLPLTILAVPFTKFLNTYATRGEFGKVKRLLQVAFAFAAAVFLVSILCARFVMPLFFERARIAEGSLGLLVLATGLLGAFSPIFTNALQGLKRFKALTAVNVLGAPIRLAVMLVAMPFRAVSGYLLGQAAIPATSILASCFCFRRELGPSVKSRPFWRDDGRSMLRYAAPVALNLVAVGVLAAWQSLLIRQRLPDLDSAAYYMISRLAEIGSYVALSMMVVVFPMAAEAQTSGRDSGPLLRRLLFGSLLSGLAVAALYATLGRRLLSLVPLWAPYAAFAPQLVLLTVRSAIGATGSAFVTYETASARFSFLWYAIPCAVLETLPLAIFTGAEIFRGRLPDRLVDAMVSLRAARLDFFLWWLFSVSLFQLLCIVAHLLLRRARRRTRP